MFIVVQSGNGLGANGFHFLRCIVIRLVFGLVADYIRNIISSTSDS
jgi:hypothetical protein